MVQALPPLGPLQGFKGGGGGGSLLFVTYTTIQGIISSEM